MKQRPMSSCQASGSDSSRFATLRHPYNHQVESHSESVPKGLLPGFFLGLYFDLLAACDVYGTDPGATLEIRRATMNRHLLNWDTLE